MGAFIHESHKLAWFRGVVYCLKCAASGVKQVPSKLKSKCQMRPGNAQGIAKLKSLKNGEYAWPLPEGTRINQLDDIFR